MTKKRFNYNSCFDIIGPIMVGPSSSHTAGVCAIGRAIFQLFGKMPQKVRVTYYESFAQTHQGHGTDYAMIAGLMGMKAADNRVSQALDLAREAGMEFEFIESKEPSPCQHANTAVVEVSDEESTLTVTGVSIGGGAMEIRFIDDQGLRIEPCYTTNLVVLKSHLPVYKEKVDEICDVLGVTIDSFQSAAMDGRYLTLLNTDRQLTSLEVEALFDRLHVDKAIRLG
ncbi:serine dehydratase beta chain [Catellicoccus marimammalium]|uniref:L-serine ammonia-lyase n=1 Tax=Catellicoccus marimammalium M35/04/3 TaxID=1234409 RepID=K8ZQG2_9ENTE|nr:serine dehydratase beta chain [Catellicoccus marimammalium]EKU27816.1 L-serine dehydratase, beta subunit [Catellicoccus marimammalium M35/04/3]